MKTKIELTYVVLSMERVEDTVQLKLLEELVPIPDGDVPSTPKPSWESEDNLNPEERAAKALNSQPKPSSDMDRVFTEMMDSMRKFAPAMYESMQRGRTNQQIVMGNMVPIARLIRRRACYLELSDEQYKALGSPGLNDRIRLGVAVRRS